MESLRGKEGFTLIEVLTSLLILAIVFTTLFSSYRTTLETVRDTEAIGRIYYAAWVALERMADDLEAAYVPATKEGAANGANEVFLGEEITEKGLNADRLTFVSMSNSCLEAEDCRPMPTRIRYETRRDGEGLTLYRGESHLYGGTGRGMLPLATGLLSVEFFYFDHSGKSSRSWDSPRPPAMVTMILTFIDEGDKEDGLRFTTSVAVSGARQRDEKSPEK